MAKAKESLSANDRFPTRTDWIDRRLKETILAGELAPGQKVNTLELSKRWNVSQTPLREAIQRLAGQGLVEQIPQLGARVYRMTHRDAKEIYDLRLLLDPMALASSVKNSDSDHQAEVLEALKELDATIEQEESGQISRSAHSEAHMRFHTVLVARCESKRMLAFSRQLAEHSLLYQTLRIEGRSPRDALSEHRALAKSVLEGDPDSAAALLRTHLSRALGVIERVLSAAP